MLEFLLLACLAFTGLCLAQAVAKPKNLVEAAAYTLLFGLVVIPYGALVVALGAELRISPSLLAGISFPVAAASGLLWWRSRKRLPAWRAEGSDILMVAAAGVVGLAAAAYYSDEDALVSIASYAQRSEARCFYHMTYELVASLTPGRSFEPLKDFYKIISTPSNLLFTSPFLPLLGLAAFRVVYAAIQVLAFLFFALCLRRWGASTLASLGAGLLAVASPLALSIEVLDRNGIAFAMTAALYYTLETRRRQPVLHGWLFAVTAGTGLRFLPLLNVVFVAGAYLATRARPRQWIIFSGVAAAAFAVNVPHLFFHGFHSLGEERSTMALASALWTEGHRTPLQPLPVGLQYLQESLGHLGALGAGLVLVGAARAWKTRRREAVALVFVSLVVWLSLVIQRDWIEGDKARIWLSAWTPVPLFFGLAIAWLQERGDRLRPALLLVAGSVAAFGLAAAMRSLDAPADAESPARKLVYQSDTPAFARFYRERYARVGLLPDYARLGDKLDLWRKRRLETMTAATLASAVKRTELASVGWFRRAFAVTRPEPVPAGEQPTMSVEVDLERLVTDPPGALRPAPRGALPFVDLTRARELREVHYKAVPVTWQPEPLTLTAFPRGAPARAAGELVLELNAFVSLGRDAGGLERVAAVHLLPSLAQRARTDHHGLRGRGPHRALRARGILQSVGAPPQRDREPRVVLTVPGGFRVVLRYWVVDGELGTPFRVDSWVIEAGDDGRPAAAFRPCEPESYL